MVSQNLILDFLKESKEIKQYNKFGNVTFLVAETEQEVVTITADGKETTNIAKVGDYIVINPTGERYVIKPAKFHARYEVIEENLAACKGSCWGIEYEGEQLEFEAPWGETMVCKNGDMLVSPNPELTEVYRIACAEFEATYKIENN